MTNTNERPALGELTVGQQVMVRRSPNDMRRRGPEERWIPAVVTKAARVWVEMKRPDVDTEWSIYRWRMRRDSQDEGTQYSGNNASFATLEQYEWELARAWADEVLQQHGLRVEFSSPWRGREIELAQLLTDRTPADQAG